MNYGFNMITTYGRLGGVPKPIQTKTGTPMTVANLAVSLPVANSEETATQWLNIVALGKQAELLARHEQGDLIGVMGSLGMTRWNKNGEVIEQMQVMIQSIMSARTVRPAGGRRPTNGQGQQQRHDRQDGYRNRYRAPQPEFNDPIPF